MNSRGAVRHLELFVPLRTSASPSGWELCAETKWRAQGEFLRGGTDGSNPSPSSSESANFQYLSVGGTSLICHDPEPHERQQDSVKFGDDGRARDAEESGTWGIFIDARVTPAKDS